MKIKLLVVISGLFILTSSFLCTGVFDMSFTSMDQEDHLISDYQGKEIMFVVLPVTQTADDTAFLAILDSVRVTYRDSLVVIGVPSYENGYVDENMNMLIAWYQSIAGDSVLLSVGTYTSKSSGELQHPIFSWLTHKDQNEHFDLDITGSRQCFFIDPEGVLHAIIMPGETLDVESVANILGG